jgi:hypothetical protein
MKNSIQVETRFSYQGENHHPSAQVDLDLLMRQDITSPSFYIILARENRIDTYSYLYEVMEQSELSFNNPTGVAADCLVDGHFDMEAFNTKWREQQISTSLQSIARSELGIEDLEKHQDINRALTKAYRLGQNNPEK